MKTLKCILFLSFYGILMSGFSQTTHTVYSLLKVQQSCLDSGRHMPYCSYAFLNQMDSILNIVYEKYYLILNSNQKQTLKKEQSMWFKKRDASFDQANKEYDDNRKSGEWGADMRVIAYQDKSAFIVKRVLTLLKRYETRLKH